MSEPASIRQGRPGGTVGSDLRPTPAGDGQPGGQDAGASGGQDGRSAGGPEVTLATPTTPADRKLPPIPQLGIGALVLTVASGIYLAALAQRHPNLLPPSLLLAGAAAAILSAAALLLRVQVWNWPKFKKVFGWALLEYSVIAGMLVYVFLLDHMPSSTLTLFLIALVIFALDIPMMFGFSVARFQVLPSPRDPAVGQP